MNPGRDWIAARIPHQGGMCLLDGVLEWNAETIRCAASGHRRPDNPLRGPDGLGIACGIEYAAQAMAVHAALLQPGDRPRAGFLTSVREVAWGVDRLDTVPEDLDIQARRMAAGDAGALYAFALRAGGRELLSGRATVVVDTAALGQGEA